MTNEIIAQIFVLLGSIWVLISLIGIIRLPDYNTKLHALSKVTSLGLAFILFGTIIHFWQLAVVIKAIMVIGFVFLTIPIASHVFAKTLKDDSINSKN